MGNKQVKEDLISALFSRDIFTRQISDVQYVTRCPYCGDSASINKGHFYIRINPNDNYPVLYHCFKCEEKGVLKEEGLSMLEIENLDLKSGLFTLNKTSSKLDKKNLITETKNIYFDYMIPEAIRGPKTRYVEDRLGYIFTEEDFSNMKIITSLKEFLDLNNIKNAPFPGNILSKIEDHYVGFLTHGNSHILFRDITEKEELSWIKYPISKESRDNRVFYTMSCEVDPLTTEEFTINLAEGVMDTLSACYNLGFNDKNCMNIAVSGKYYDRLLMYLLDLGLVGSNITINIFADNDYSFNKKGNNYVTTFIDYYRKILSTYKHLYKEINVYYNQAAKDIGRPKSDIVLKRYKL